MHMNTVIDYIHMDILPQNFFLLLSTHSWEIDSSYRVEIYGQPCMLSNVHSSDLILRWR